MYSDLVLAQYVWTEVSKLTREEGLWFDQMCVCVTCSLFKEPTYFTCIVML